MDRTTVDVTATDVAVGAGEAGSLTSSLAGAASGVGVGGTGVAVSSAAAATAGVGVGGADGSS